MSSCPTIDPAICRAPLLDSDLRAALSRLLEAASGDISGLLIHLVQVDDTLFVSGRPRILDRRGDLLSPWRDRSLSEDLLGAARDILGRLIDDEGVSTTIETADAAGLMAGRPGLYRVAIFEGCAVFSVEDPLAQAIPRIERIRRDPGSVALRAPICTILLEEAGSLHARFGQPAKIAAALRVWRRASGMDGLDPQAAIRVRDPDPDTIYNCDSEDVHG